ncbi:hypothetical protein PVAND_000145 [Polypedilum vanderplanki]|uniref:Uncharacterized protein n=1 Tax=Polypedilum vanderplanki TaxID=319348 RepID=A0A9J6BKE8_POLVA|nr:hypothetical protein PVAND_000145 [Polypedilum vanderplanki]
MLAPLQDQLKNVRFILASGSPRRQEYIKNLGIEAELCSSEFDERTIKPKDYKSYDEFVIAIANGKAEEVEKRLQNELKDTQYCIIGADTINVLNDKIFGKPKDEDEAFRMLKELNGQPHFVYTGCVLKFNDKVVKFCESTKVFFGKLTEEQIKAYIDSREPLDKCGAYGTEDLGSCMVERIEGDYFANVGIPLYRISVELCKAFNYDTNK